MADYNIAIPIILKHEGGYVNDPDDKGAETYRGISRKYNPNWSGWKVIDAKPHPIKYNTIFPELENQVKDYYKVAYWNKINGDSIKDQSTANLIFDTYVNSGGYVGWMAKKGLGENPTLSKSIPFNSDTVKTINSQNPQKFFEGFKNARTEFFKRIGTGKQAKFLTGWLKRVSEFDYTGTIKKNAPILAFFFALSLVGLIVLYIFLFKRK